jgi:hypothetical protein
MEGNKAGGTQASPHIPVWDALTLVTLIRL